MKYILVPALLLFLLGCAKTKHDPVEFIKTAPSAEALIREADAAVVSKEYKNAAKLYSEVWQQYPHYDHIADVKLKEMQAQFDAQMYDELGVASEYFINSHPTHRRLDYVHYIGAMSHFNRIDVPNRDQTDAQDALEAFKQLVSQFPGSKYASEARIKIAKIRDHLAAKEMTVGRFYLRRGNLVGATARFNAVLQNYPNTSFAAEALYRLVEGARILGARDLEQLYVAKLRHEHPKSHWTTRLN